MELSKAVAGTQIQACDPKETAPTTFGRVLDDELDCVNDADRDNLIGLAFSGGGIRSATFNLGILQAFAEKGLLRKFDYLSTVSGGGYIGSWLAALTRRLTDTVPHSSFGDVEKALSPGKYGPEQRSEPSVLHWLRLYSDYLTPHTGAVSGDTWAMLGTWMRNVFLNQSILAMLFVSIYALCQSVLLPMVLVQDNGHAYLIGGASILFLGSVSMATNIVQEVPSKAILQTFFQRIKVSTTVMLPFVVACILLNCALWQRTDLTAVPIVDWALAGAAFYFVVWGIVAIMGVARRLTRRRKGKPAKIMISVPALLIFSPVAGAAGGCLMLAYEFLLSHLGDWTSTNWLVIVFGSGMVMGIMLLVAVLHLGLVGRGSMDLVREWWARLGGYLLLITMGWLLLAGTCAFAPLGVRWALFRLRGWSIDLGVLWVLYNYFGIKAAKSPKTAGAEADDPKAKKDGAPKSGDDGESKSGWGIMKLLKSPRLLDALAKAAPYVFLVGLILVMATVVQVATGLVFDIGDSGELERFNGGYSWQYLSDDYWRVLESASPVWLAGMGAIFFIGAAALSWRVDVNDFSLHHFYRNRLVRCYLGASNPERTPEPFTGFDPGDDVALCEFAENYPGPYPILNAALNITGGEELGYASRRAKSFVFTPLYCGYELSTSGEGRQRFTNAGGYLPSFARTALGRTAGGLGKFGAEDGISLGTAMAISGAAASPNMGYYTTPATAFFMALFDVRLGWWMGNPRHPKQWLSPGPALGLGYLLSEVFAQSDQKRGYVYLSDGGHFENLAVYELIRRHCRLIVACDAAADPCYQFNDLLSLIEKARTDFGARIEIDYAALQPGYGGRQSKQNWVTGTIYYDPRDCNDTGTLILIKASMPEKPPRGAAPCKPGERILPDDVWRYYDQHKTFPHQSTADQWFDELQFESYRALGEYIGVDASAEVDKAIKAVLVPAAAG
jgi:hypothetical protein